MKQKGQRFDTQALTQEAQALTRDVVSAPFRLRTYRLIRKILIGFILVSIANGQPLAPAGLPTTGCTS